MKTIVLLGLLILSSCIKFDDTDYRLKVKNNTSKFLYYGDYFSYPDTSIGAINIPRVRDNYIIKPYSERAIPTQVSWEQLFSRELPSDTLMIMIFDQEIVDKVPWDTVRKNYMILKRFDLSLEDLKRMNWTITYP